MKMLNELKKTVQEMELGIAEDYFVNESIYERDENDSEYIKMERMPYEIDGDDNFITELERDLDLDWNIRLELDTENRVIAIKHYSKLW